MCEALYAGVDMLMPSFNTLSGVPSIANSWLMKKILKEEWNSDVLVISDWGAVGELINHGIAGNMKEASRIAFENECHIDMCAGGYMKHLKELVEDGVFSEEQIDQAVQKVLELKDKLGLFEDPYHGASPERQKAECLTPENRALVRKVAAECAVLLKNDGILPFSENVKKIALIGPFADNNEIKGPWAGVGCDEDTISVRQGIENMLPNAEKVTVKGCGCTWNDLDKTGFAEAVAAAKEADAVILCLGEPQNYSGEGNCRTDIDLPGVQNELAEEIVKANPCGKLSMTFPQTVGQCPIYYNHTSTGRPKLPEKDSVHQLSNSRPVQQLIAFEKVEFDAYETKVVEFTIEEPMLRFWNNENKFVSEPGEFQISTGYADHLIHTKELTLQ